ncbi:hypothetical protein AB0E04_03830 [Streptomyces sp. NPDC048251]|uniref:hypothetical protein n=1 Tax=Streptomyces sp. NPDC048251 TaxID=3154501 RepID=UPI003426899E
MPKYEHGWWVKKLYFSKAETEDIAETASAVALVAAVIPDASLSKVIAMYAGLISLGAKWAVKRNKALGIKFYLPGMVPGPPAQVFLHHSDE